ncbi:MAG TPA: hypothetical protein PLR41_15020 [Alphaproteobacteria bacterium]|nr:hypothetical protein [Alphaproteobacteria bacterium]
MRPGTLLLILAAALLGACAARPASQYGAQAPSGSQPSGQAAANPAANPVVATEERAVRVGMSAAEIAEMLGAPNTVVTDAAKRDTWTYDRIWTDTAYSASDSRGKVLMLDPAPGAGGAAAHTALTVIVMFDEVGKVRDFAYHAPSP